MPVGATSSGGFCTPMRTAPQKKYWEGERERERERERGISVLVG